MVYGQLCRGLYVGMIYILGNRLKFTPGITALSGGYVFLMDIRYLPG